MSKVIKVEPTVKKSESQVIRSKCQCAHEESITNLSHLVDRICLADLGKRAILESGQSDRLTIEEHSSMLVKIFTTIGLKANHKVLCSIVSNDEDLGGLGLYVREYKTDDKHFIVFVENDSGRREFFINYCIVE